MQYLEFMFSGFWTFVGCWMLIAISVSGVVNLVRAIMRVPITNIINNGSRK